MNNSVLTMSHLKYPGNHGKFCYYNGNKIFHIDKRHTKVCHSRKLVFVQL